VYKIVPGLEQNEYDRERDFYRDRGLPCPKDQVVEQEEDSKDGEMTPDANTNMDFHRFDEQVIPQLRRYVTILSEFLNISQSC
jgi:polycomb group RING finger protein 3